ncbi:hypothetical protein COD96_22340 [Bacillus thuringiensis]|nr:hypothetical protein CON19_27130 [Bacillus thuringiensis]PGV65496.1 hypothetical protein COD96_22340 [Bacillus thuringiensis]
MKSTRGYSVCSDSNYEIVCFNFFTLSKKELAGIPTSSFCFSDCIRIKPFKYSRNNNEVFISRLLSKILYFNKFH